LLLSLRGKEVVVTRSSQSAFTRFLKWLLMG
jgi:hypothetical protein